MKIGLTCAESNLLEYCLDLSYEKYATPPFRDVEDRFSVTMDPSQDFVKAAERLEETEEAREKNDILAELGYDDDPTSEGFVHQLKKAEFYATQALLRRWFNGLQYSLYCKARFMADEEKVLEDYWSRHDHPRMLITYASLEEGAESTLHLEPDAIEDIRSLVHLICDCMQKMDATFIRARDRAKAERLAGREEKVNEDELAILFSKAEDRLASFQNALKPLIEKLMAVYRQSKFKRVL